MGKKRKGSKPPLILLPFYWAFGTVVLVLFCAGIANPTIGRAILDFLYGFFLGFIQNIGK